MGEQDQSADSNKGADEGEIKSSQAAAGADTVKLAAGQVLNRRSRWISSVASFRYVNALQNNNDIRVRDSDKATTIALVFCCAAALVCLLVPQLEKSKIVFVLAADVLIGLSLLMYVANRFGIVTTFPPRQALLTWQLMLGSSLLGIFMTINLALLIAYLIAQNPIIVAQ